MRRRRQSGSNPPSPWAGQTFETIAAKFRYAPTKNPPEMEGRRFPLGCSLGATSAFAIHLAREGQVGVGVAPTLDDAPIIGHGCGECQHTTHAVKSDHGKVS